MKLTGFFKDLNGVELAGLQELAEAHNAHMERYGAITRFVFYGTLQQSLDLIPLLDCYEHYEIALCR